MHALECQQCHNPFKSNRKDAKYCSDACRKAASRKAIASTVEQIAADKQPKSRANKIVNASKPIAEPEKIITAPTVIKTPADITRDILPASNPIGLTAYQLTLRKKKLGY